MTQEITLDDYNKVCTDEKHNWADKTSQKEFIEKTEPFITSEYE